MLTKQRFFFFKFGSSIFVKPKELGCFLAPFCWSNLGSKFQLVEYNMDLSIPVKVRSIGRSKAFFRTRKWAWHLSWNYFFFVLGWWGGGSHGAFIDIRTFSKRPDWSKHESRLRLCENKFPVFFWYHQTFQQSTFFQLPITTIGTVDWEPRHAVMSSYGHGGFGMHRKRKAGNSIPCSV